MSTNRADRGPSDRRDPRRTGQGGAQQGRPQQGRPHQGRPHQGRPHQGRSAGRRWADREFLEDDLPDFPEGERDDLVDVPGGVRLQKVLAEAGVGSRRHCEELIGAGRVEVDGHTVRRFGARVDPERQVIKVDGRRVPGRPGLTYIALNKPAGVVSTMSDPQGRPTLADHVADRTERLFHVGRLDYDTEGLLLLTNDGELANRLTHPRYGVTKTYLAEITGPVPRDLGRRLREGVVLDDGPARADSFRVVERVGSRVMVELTLHEGRKHIVRRLLAEAGHPVRRLVRVAFGPVKLGGLKPGATRALTVNEIGELYAAVGM